MFARTISTPVGELRLVGTRDALAEVQLPPLEPSSLADGQSPALDLAEQQLDEYFRGERTTFTVPLALEGTSFQREVWQALLTIGFGETRSYVEIARQLGRPKASRAVGQANGRNPVAIIVPCHRVIAADASLGGYGGGLALKRQLLALEGLAEFR